MRQVPLFADLEARQIDQIADLLGPRIAMPEERLISEGERGDSIYFIASGVVEAVTAGQTVRLTRGDFFGEMAPILHVPRQATVTARTYCQLLVLGSRDLRALLRDTNARLRQAERGPESARRLSHRSRWPSGGTVSRRHPAAWEDVCGR